VSAAAAQDQQLQHSVYGSRLSADTTPLSRMSIAAGLQQHQHYRVNIRSTVSAVAAEVCWVLLFKSNIN